MALNQSLTLDVTRQNQALTVMEQLQLAGVMRTNVTLVVVEMWLVNVFIKFYTNRFAGKIMILEFSLLHFIAFCV